MSAYRRVRVRRRHSGGRVVFFLVVFAVVFTLLAGNHHGRWLPSASAGSYTAPHGADAAIAFAHKQLGKPYQWGGNGPASYDCSGLTKKAEAHAGIIIPRTSQEQWAHLQHVPAGYEARGDLVFFAGADGTDTAPGHVGLVINAHKKLMIEAWQTGYPIRIAYYGDRNPIGFGRP